MPKLLPCPRLISFPFLISSFPFLISHFLVPTFSSTPQRTRGRLWNLHVHTWSIMANEKMEKVCSLLTQAAELFKVQSSTAYKTYQPNTPMPAGYE